MGLHTVQLRQQWQGHQRGRFLSRLSAVLSSLLRTQCEKVRVCILQDMSSLIHSMYEVLEASVKQPHGGTAPLRIKLVVTPSADPERTSQIGKKTFLLWLREP